ncbi:MULTISPECIES: BlaI/MecI/CopY family transcriptional regulator [Prauserella]|uniref:CopY family transcriptional regulator n=2 Tax=Prauserella TaxID=142577 RepID=A0A318LF89_9PSEU|nr:MULTISPECIES: BlaI/MecI/CopY family transcriptional regulator [Prauserella]PXY16796.1 CopY family transcriptional regulator [Prauserella coralliicola]PXY17500.1 CopY family transcriptional regulator [Prauserella flavalba]TKG59677.1 BlaI/MecI/CopY family transcriptional regulator [Prauserella endophytica]
MGRLEGEILELLWAGAGPLTVRDVLEQLNAARSRPLAYTTVMTVLARLADKGAARRRPAGRGYAYEPVGRDPASLAVRRVIDEHGQAAVAHFLAEAEADDDLRERLRRIIEGRS